MTIRKTIWLTALIILPSFSAHAQRFDWVKAYSGTDILSSMPNNQIVESIIDSEGNVYFVGLFTQGAHIGNVDLMPMAPYGPNCNTMNTVIAKMSPSGEILWHKSIHANDSRSNNPIGIKIVGDTAIVCMVTCSLMQSENTYLYFLDTLLHSNDAIIENYDSNFATHFVTAFITFDLDGMIKEQHFVQYALVDSSGHTIALSDINGHAPDSSYIMASPIGYLFNVDSHGNIYVCRRTQDAVNVASDNSSSTVRTLSVSNGGISAMKIFVDGYTRFTFRPDNRYNNWNQMIMKFSPSFDSLYWARYVFDADSNYNDMYFNSLISSLTIDTSDNYYVTLNVNNYEGDTGIRIAGSDGLFFNVTPNDPMSGCMVSYNCNHEALFVRQISCVDEQYNFPKNYFYVSSEIEEESNSVFMLGMIQKDPDIGWDSHAPTFFGPDSVDLRNNAYWVRLDKSDGRMLSYGKARSATATKISGYEGDGRTARVNLTAKNNRVFAQVKYHQDIAFLDSTITMAPTSYGMGLMIWDYDGHEVEYIDYVSDGINNNCGTILLKDSTLYLSGTLYSGATFGNISISATGSSQTYLARYTDSAFMTPYIYIDPRAEQSIEWGQELSFPLQASPIALTATASSGLPVSYICTDTSIAKVVGSLLYLLSAGTTTVTAYQNGSQYGYYPSTPITKNLTVNNVGIKETLQTKRILYPNPTKGNVFISVDNEQISNVYITTSFGQEREIMLKENTIPMTGLPSGIYYIKVVTTEHIYQQKIIKL